MPSTSRMRWSAVQLVRNHSKHQYEEEEDEDPKRHQHAPALGIAPFEHLVVGLDVCLAELWALPDRPEFPVAVARR